jgi:hypothetical protein
MTINGGGGMSVFFKYLKILKKNPLTGNVRRLAQSLKPINKSPIFLQGNFTATHIQQEVYHEIKHPGQVGRQVAQNQGQDQTGRRKSRREPQPGSRRQSRKYQREGSGKGRRDQGRRREVNMDACQKNLTALRKESIMLWTIFVILLVLWAMGLLTGYTMGGVIHALLVIAIIVILFQVLQGRRRA